MRIIFIVGFCVLSAIQSCVPKAADYSHYKRAMPAVFAENSDTSKSLEDLNFKAFISEKPLQNLIDSAILNNYDLKQVLTNIASVRADIMFATGVRKPFLALGPITSFRRFGIYTMDGSGNATTFIEGNKLIPVNLPDFWLGGTASWEADIWGKLSAKKKSAVMRLTATEEGRHLLLTDLVAQVASLYYEIQALDNQIGSIERTIFLQDNALEMAKIQKRAARATELGVTQFQAQLEHLKAEKYEAIQNRVDISNQINYLLGRYSKPIPRDTFDLDDRVPVDFPTGKPLDLLSNRPDIRAAEAMLHSTGFDVQAARKAFLPQLIFTGTLGMQAYRTGLLLHAPQSLAFGLFNGLLTPIANRSLLKADFQRASAAQLNALYNYQERTVAAFNEVSTLAQNLQNLKIMIQSRTEQAKVLTYSVEVANELFRTGKATYLEVLVAQQNELMAKLELADSQKRYRQARVNLYRALGGGWR